MKKVKEGIPVFRYRSMKEIKKKLKRKRRPILALGICACMLLAAAASGISADGLVKTASSAWSAVADDLTTLPDQAHADGTAAALKTTFHSLNDIDMNAFVGLEPGGQFSLFDGPTLSDSIVRTFFQLEIKSLETRMSPEMLYGLTEAFV